MITPNDIKLQLMQELPKYTDKFGTVFEGSAVVLGGVIKVTSVGHKLTTGDIIFVTDAKVILPITLASFDSGTDRTTLTTGYEHDRTSGTIDIGGFNKAVLQNFDDPTYNGSDFTILSATRTTMVISADAAPTGALGEMVEPRDRLLGAVIVTVVDVDNFTVSLDGEAIPDGEIFEDFKYSSSQRILVAADEERAVSMYKQHRDADPILFVIFSGESASKDRNAINDAVAANTSQNPMHLTYIPEVTLLTFVRTPDELLASTEHQFTYETLRPSIMRAMYGHIFDNTDTLIQFAAHEIFNTPVFHNKGYYIHRFVYNVPYRVSILQGDVAKISVSFRDLIVNSKMFDTEGALLSLEVSPEI